jgi:predicted acyltransferase (DUF342 family)
MINLLRVSLLLCTFYGPHASSQDVEVKPEIKVDLGSASKFTALANTYYSGGSASKIHGNVIANTYSTTGAGSNVHGNFSSGDVLTLGAGAKVYGNAESKGAGNATANTLITGSLFTLGVGTMGDGAHVEVDFISGLDGTIGANARLSEEWGVGEGSVATASASSNRINSDAVHADIQHLDWVSRNIDHDMLTATSDLNAAKDFLATLAPTHTTLPPTSVIDSILFSGTYHAASWSTTAGTKLTLDGQGQDNAMWVFNVDDILAFGGDSKVELFNVGNNAKIFWNVGSKASLGGYASLGDGASVTGVIMAEDYVMVGANASIMHASSASGNCAGVYSTTSYISVGANATLGGDRCLPRDLSLSSDVSAAGANITFFVFFALFILKRLIRRKND